MLDLLQVLSFLLRRAKDLELPRSLFFVAILAGVLSGGASIGFINIITRALQEPAPRADLAWIFAGLCVALPVFRFTSRAVLLRLVQKMLFSLRLELSRRVLGAPLRELEKIGPARLLATLTQDINAIVGVLSNVPIMTLHLTVVLGCLIYLFVLSPYLLTLVLVSMGVGVLGYQLPAITAQRYFRTMRTSWDHLFEAMRALVEGGKELKMHGGRREEFFEQELEESARQVQDTTVTGGTIYAAAGSWGQVLFFIVIGWILFLVPSEHRPDAGTITGFVLTILYMMAPLEGILSLLPIIGRAVVSVQKVQSLGLSLVAQPGDIQAQPEPWRGTWRSLSLVGVTHAYPGEVEGETFTLGPLDLAFQPGEVVFIVGGNGSGKTTLAKLLVGLYAPQSGEVQLDGLAVDDGARDACSRACSVSGKRTRTSRPGGTWKNYSWNAR